MISNYVPFIKVNLLRLVLSCYTYGGPLGGAVNVLFSVQQKSFGVLLLLIVVISSIFIHRLFQVRLGVAHGLQRILVTFEDC